MSEVINSSIFPLELNYELFWLYALGLDKFDLLSIWNNTLLLDLNAYWLVLDKYNSIEILTEHTYVQNLNS